MNNQNNIRPNIMGQAGQPGGQLQQPQVAGMVGNVQGPQGNVNMFNNMMNRPMGPNVARRMPGPGGIAQQIPGAPGMVAQQANMGQINPQQMQQTQQAQLMQQQNPQQQQQQQQSSVLISQLNILPQNQNNIRMQFINQQQQQLQQQNQVQMANPQQQQPPQQMNKPAEGPVAKERIWSGALEYIDKQHKVTRQISVVATAAVKDGEPEM